MSQVPTLGEIDYGLKSLKDAIGMIEARQKMNEIEKAEQVRQGNYANAAVHTGIGVGLMGAENMVRLEIEALEHRRLAVEAYLKGGS